MPRAGRRCTPCSCALRATTTRAAARPSRSASTALSRDLCRTLAEDARERGAVVEVAPALPLRVLQPGAGGGGQAEVEPGLGRGGVDEVGVLPREREREARRVVGGLDRFSAPFGLRGERRRGQHVEGRFAG